MRPPKKDNRQRLAYHEAGHAVVARSQGIDFLSVTIGDGTKGEVDYARDLRDRIKISDAVFGIFLSAIKE